MADKADLVALAKSGAPLEEILTQKDSEGKSLLDPLENFSSLSLNQKAAIAFYTQCCGVVSDVCDVIGITRSTFNKWLKDPVFKKCIAEAEPEADAELLDEAVSLIRKKIKVGNLKAAMFVAERKGRNKGWGNETKLSVEPRQIVVQKDDQGFFEEGVVEQGAVEETLRIEENEVEKNDDAK